MIGSQRATCSPAGTAWIVAVVVWLLASAILPARAIAQDNGLADVLVDGFYGGLIGALVGTAAMALTEDPGDHLSYISTGAAIGAIGGTTYGLYHAVTAAMVEVDRGRIAWTLPSLIPTATDDGFGHGSLTYSAALIRYRFR